MILYGCGETEDNTTLAKDSTNGLSLIRVLREDDTKATGSIIQIEYYYHKDTKVVYMMVHTAGMNARTAGITPLYKADGTLMTIDEFNVE
jgi:hypothetical protein